LGFTKDSKDECTEIYQGKVSRYAKPGLKLEQSFTYFNSYS